ncbi:cytochrome d ubiquinol oxidase subunit II [Herbihabitans rhizosphaerae]|uniref:Cytochrome d ubiquinol oxidase subunit II n=1 Tax=Herbihabitans rhizosphaerae TaxID=1872711 RepID=A0A4Q7L4Y8_9PSEU|nr:cytochrome d ubiquinol oxidase subunit II [Herbihabitans rhizosphaerae]RZS44314.1 cytochrome d ubiquinol oxidase subunit II [Herbihabitans rhizosphaerae]
MDTLLLVVIAMLFAGYFALAGFDYGTGLLYRTLGTDEPERRRVLGTVGPFFLGNEVWLVAAIGLMIGAFPRWEGELLSGAYPIVVAILVGLITFTAAFQLRSRRDGARRRVWDTLVTGGAAVTVAGWGLLLGNLVRGLPLENGRPAGDVLDLFSPYAITWGVGFVALFGLHGAAFIAMRTAGKLAERARRAGRACAGPAVLFVVAAGVGGMLSDEVGAAVTRPWLAIGGAAVFAALLMTASSSLARYRPRIAFACTTTVCALLMPLLLAARYPNLLTSTVDSKVLTVEQGVAGGATLDVLGWVALAVIPLVLLLQWTVWWGNRRKVDERTPLFW